jgi:proline iminopeptidase
MKKFFILLLITFFYINVHAQQEATIESNGSQLFYRTFGAGTPILLINGGPGMNSNGFVGLATELAKYNLIILYDQRGTGRSLLKKVDTSTITMKLMTEDIENLRKHLKINKWTVFGHSFGGMLASYYASYYPQNISSLILSSSGGIDLELQSYVTKNINAKLGREESDSLQYWSNAINNGDTTFFAKSQRAKWLAPAYVYNKKNIPAIAERLTQGNPTINGLVWSDLQKIKFDCSGRLSKVNIPALIIQGKQDIIEEKTALKAHKVLKNSTVILLDKCVHYGWLDKKDEYFAAIEKFLQER